MTEYVIIDGTPTTPEAAALTDACIKECEKTQEIVSAAVLAWLIQIQTGCITEAVNGLSKLIEAHKHGKRIVEIIDGAIVNSCVSGQQLLGQALRPIGDREDSRDITSKIRFAV